MQPCPVLIINLPSSAARRAAMASQCARLGLAVRDLRIDLAGRQLEIAWDQDDHVRMTGGAVSVFDGEWHEDQ